MFLRFLEDHPSRRIERRPRGARRESATSWVAAVLGATALCCTTLAPAQAASATLLEKSFDTGPDECVFQGNAFGPSQSTYVLGDWGSSFGDGSGGLRVRLGGIDNTTRTNMSGGWRCTLTLTEPVEGVTVSFSYRLTQTGYYESDEYSRVLFGVNGARYGRGPKEFVDHIGGDGESSDFSGYRGTSGVLADRSTGWLSFEAHLGRLEAGTHSLDIGGFNNKKNASNERTEILIDDLRVTDGNAVPPPTAAQAIIDRLGPSEPDPAGWQPLTDEPGNAYTRFKSDIHTLSTFCGFLNGTYICDRYNMHTGPESASYQAAKEWVVQELEAFGYAVERHLFQFNGYDRENIYATKVGATSPDEMYIVSCHLDGRGHESPPYGPGGAADDDASGCALVLAAARAFAEPDVTTDKSIRFIFWNNEETGYHGSTAYRNDRAPLRGTSEPNWLGIIQHDMILYDHGKPFQANQIAGADIDVEYRRGTTFAAQSQALADALKAAAGRYTVRYPAEIGDYSEFTDDKPFWNLAPSISVRENRRCCEITNNHPHYHKPSDVYESYSEDDYRLGFDTVRMTIGAVAELSGARVVTNNPPVANLLAVTLDEDTSVVITLTGSDSDGDPLTFSIVTDPTHGVLSGTAPALTYTPDADYFGSDSFTFVVNDGQIDSEPATVSITVVNVNDPPVAFDQVVTVVPGASVQFTLQVFDADGDPLTYTVYAANTDFGVVTGEPPTLTYAADGEEGTDVILFSVEDAESSSDLAEVTIVVAQPNEAPVAESATITTLVDTPVDFTLVASDPDLDPISYEYLSRPSHGRLTGLEPTLTYTPFPGYTGSDSFSFRVFDGRLYSETATIEIVVGTVTDAPLLSASFDTGAQGFIYGDDTFRGTSQPNYASGAWGSAYGASGGGLRVLLGGRDDRTIRNMSGGWRIDFTLDQSKQVRVSVRVNLTQSSEYESDEYSEALVSINGVLVGQGGTDYLARVVGNGNGGSPISTGWQTYELDLGTLAAGTHRLVIGGYNNKKTWRDESTEVRIDDVVISAR